MDEQRESTSPPVRSLPGAKVGRLAIAAGVALLAAVLGGDWVLEQVFNRGAPKPMASREDGSPLPASEAEWKALLTPEQYYVLRRQGTERAFTGEYWNTKDDGMYRCAGCGQPLFRSDDKFDSGTGWPSFTAPHSPESVAVREDYHLFMRRTEVVCSRCQGHLGHVFEDGPAPTGLRYCMNSAALKFEPSPPAEADH